MVEPWYKGGLRFKCTGCGQCCTGAPGYVFVSEEEVERLAALLNLSIELFARRFLRQVGDRLALKERHNFDCIFLDGKRCTVYAERPTQCRTFPFWPQNLKDPAAWKETARECEGINEEAPLVQLGQIEAARQNQEASNPDV